MKTKYNSINEFLDDVIKILDNNEVNFNSSEDNCNKKEEVKEEPKCSKDTKLKDSRPKEDKPLKSTIDTVTFDDNNFYILNEMVNGCAIDSEQHLIFEHTSDGYKVPGITEDQLLLVLYNRYKNNPKKLDLINQLMD